MPTELYCQMRDPHDVAACDTVSDVLFPVVTALKIEVKLFDRVRPVPDLRTTDSQCELQLYQ